MPPAAQNGTVAHLAPLQMGVQSSGAPMMNGHNGNQYTQAGGAHLQPMSAPPMINSNGQSPFFTPTSNGKQVGPLGKREPPIIESFMSCFCYCIKFRVSSVCDIN